MLENLRGNKAAQAAVVIGGRDDDSGGADVSGGRKAATARTDYGSTPRASGSSGSAYPPSSNNEGQMLFASPQPGTSPMPGIVGAASSGMGANGSFGFYTELRKSFALAWPIGLATACRLGTSVVDFMFLGYACVCG